MLINRLFTNRKNKKTTVICIWTENRDPESERAYAFIPHYCQSSLGLIGCRYCNCWNFNTKLYEICVHRRTIVSFRKIELKKQFFHHPIPSAPAVIGTYSRIVIRFFSLEERSRNYDRLLQRHQLFSEIPRIATRSSAEKRRYLFDNASRR